MLTMKEVTWLISRGAASRLRLEEEARYGLGGRQGPPAAEERRTQGEGAGLRRAEPRQAGRAQDLLLADDRYSVLVVLQAMDAAGKDGTIKHVMSGVNPQGCQVFSFKKPSRRGARPQLPLALHRRRCPSAAASASSTARTTRTCSSCASTPRCSSGSGCPPGKRGQGVLGGPLRGHQRLRAAPRPQRHAHPQVLPARLQGGAEEALPGAARRPRKALEVLDAATSPSARYWDDYQDAYEDTLDATSTEWAPWYVIPADHKWVTRALVVGHPQRRHRRSRTQAPPDDGGPAGGAAGCPQAVARRTRVLTCRDRASWPPSPSCVWRSSERPARRRPSAELRDLLVRQLRLDDGQIDAVRRGNPVTVAVPTTVDREIVRSPVPCASTPRRHGWWTSFAT